MSDDIILGLDPGVGSLGFYRRDTLQNGLDNQLKDGGVLIFPSGLENNNITSNSMAIDCGTNRRLRKHYYARRLCKWATLELLIKLGMCPLSVDELDMWRKYEKGRKRVFPTSSPQFMSWIKLDFDRDGCVDFSNIFELRYRLAIDNNIDLSTPRGKEMLGRVVYHMACHRGFRSSKGEKISENPNARGTEDVDDLKESEKACAQQLQAIIDEHKFPTAGCAYYYLNIEQGLRIRESEYKLTAKLNKQELKYIINLHHELGADRKNLYMLLMKTVFKVRSGASKKGEVGRCVFEKNKRRSPKSRPEFEELRAWSIINNIRYGKQGEPQNRELPLEHKQELYNNVFIKKKSLFPFSEIAKYLSKKPCYAYAEFNYDPNFSVTACPITFCLKELLGDDWKQRTIVTSNSRPGRKGASHTVIHSWETLWNKAFTGDIDDIEAFCESTLGDTSLASAMLHLMKAINKADGYAQYSVYAARKINLFLQQGYPLDKAILLANLPTAMGKDKWQQYGERVIDLVAHLYDEVQQERTVVKVTNNLIAEYKKLCLDDTTAFAVKDYSYLLDDHDKQQVYSAVAAVINDDDDSFEPIRVAVEDAYQSFFADRKRAFLKASSLRDKLIKTLVEQFHCDPSIAYVLYNHSEIEHYTYHACEVTNERGVNVRLLGSPQLSNLRSPVVLRAMHRIKNLLNYMLVEGSITNDSHIVVEIANELNDRNMRRAISLYQQAREIENQVIKGIVDDILKSHDKGASSQDETIARIAYEQGLLLADSARDAAFSSKKINADLCDVAMKSSCKSEIENRYKLWKEQNFCCIYTGRVISLSEVLCGDSVDIEHTLPLSRSLDNSLENKTLCDAHYNRHTKGNKMPAELADYEQICLRLRPWEEKVESLHRKLLNCKSRVKKAADKETKDNAIVAMHITRMEYDYWRGKLQRFKMKNICGGFVHSQLSDTRTIAKYLTAFLRTVFPNVTVQNGAVTSTFRKILGLESKDRSNNLHHAQDAALLTLIPQATYVRDKMLQLFYQLQELHGNSHLKDALQRQLDSLIRQCGLDGNINEIVNDKVNNLLVNNMSINRAFSQPRRKYRVRGRVVPLRDEDNNVVRDANGQVVPKRWLQGDCVRGEMAKNTFYGAIKVVMRDAQDNVIFENGKPKLSDIKYVKREPVKNLTTLKQLYPRIVDTWMKKYVDDYIASDNNKDLSNFVDPQGNRIRHLRCFTTNSPFKIKEETTYASKLAYKNGVYVETGKGANVFYALYKNKKYKLVTLYELSEIRRINQVKNKQDLFSPYYDDNCKHKLLFVLHIGIRVVFKRSADELLCHLDKADFIKRLYRTTEFMKDGRVLFSLHTLSDAADISPVTRPNFEVPERRLKISPTNLQIWVEGYDFDVMPTGEIKIRE